MWVVYSETGERVTPLHFSEKPEKHGKWLPKVDAELLSRYGEEPATELEDEWEAQIETMDHKDFVDFMAWVWSDKE